MATSRLPPVSRSEPLFKQGLFVWAERSVVRRLREILTQHDVEPTELFVAMYTTAWGLWLAAPVESYPIATSFDLVQALISEVALGLGIAGLGVVALISVLGSSSRPFRRNMALMQFGLWLGMAVLMGVSSHWATTASGSFLLVALAALWTYIRRSLPRR